MIKLLLIVAVFCLISMTFSYMGVVKAKNKARKRSYKKSSHKHNWNKLKEVVNYYHISFSFCRKNTSYNRTLIGVIIIFQGGVSNAYRIYPNSRWCLLGIPRSNQ
jgi:hypothetical protein